MGHKKIGLEIFFRSKKIGPEIFWCQRRFGSKLFWGQKNVGRKFFCVKKDLGRKFGLAKFYFGLLRFVCVMLLVTAKLNNNNTEFHWVCGGGLEPIIESNQLYGLRLSWVLTK